MDGVPHGDSAGGNQDVASAKAINPNVEKEFWRYGSQAPKPGEFN